MGKPIPTTPLSFTELVMRADAATLKAAYEARIQVDDLLAQRDEAYRKIADIEQKVDQLMGEPGAFIFPEPPLPVAGFNTKKPSSAPASKPAAPAPAANDGDEPATAKKH